VLLGKHEDDFPLVRLAMKFVMDTVMKAYMGTDNFYSKPELIRIMEHTGRKRCLNDQWFSTPECAQLAAKAFKSPVVMLEENVNNLYVPLLCKPSDAVRRNPLIIRHSGNHFNAFFVNYNHPNYGNPPPFRLNGYTRNLVRSENNSFFAAEWEEVFPGCYSEIHDYNPLMTGPGNVSVIASEDEEDYQKNSFS
jgi:hypothetical protein